MTDDLERRLREAFEAKATSVTPSMMDMDREREFADELDDNRGPRRWMVGGLSAAAAVAAAIGIGVVVSNQQPPVREAVAASTHHTVTHSTSTSAPTTPRSSPQDVQPQTTQVVPPPSTPPPPVTTPANTPSTSASTSASSSMSKAQVSPDKTPPPSSSSSPPTSSGTQGNFPLTGDLRLAAGTAYLPLPASTTTHVESDTTRTTVLSTNDCAAVLQYWETAMPAAGWKRAPRASKDKWFAPTGNAWAFTDTTSGACRIQISAGRA